MITTQERWYGPITYRTVAYEPGRRTPRDGPEVTR